MLIPHIDLILFDLGLTTTGAGRGDYGRDFGHRQKPSVTVSNMGARALKL
jgi:hypothetical protein